MLARPSGQTLSRGDASTLRTAERSLAVPPAAAKDSATTAVTEENTRRTANSARIGTTGIT